MTRVGLLLIVVVISVLVILPTTETHRSVRLSGKTKQKRLKDTFQLDVGKVVIDTDAGSDDAVGILQVLGHEKLHGGLNVIAITCVTGNTLVDNVVVNVLKTLDTVNRLDIPVYKGAAKSIHLTPEEDFFFGLDGFGDFDYPNPPDPEQYLQQGHAVNALIDIVSNNKGEVTILCIGPLTNIALAIRLDPTFLTNVRNVVLVGGSVEGYGNMLPGIEFNFYADPEAGFILFNSTDTSIDNVNPIIIFPWESVAKRHIIEMDWRLSVLGAIDSPQMNLLNQAEAPILNEPTWQCADALASAVTANWTIVETSSSQYLQVQTYGEYAGAAFVDYQNSLNRSHNVIIVQDINLDSYKSMLLQNLA